MTSKVTILANAAQVVTCAGPGRARRGTEMSDALIKQDVGVAITGEVVSAVEPLRDLRARYSDATEIDCEGGVLTPGLVDSHTHAIFGRPRYEEQELRAAGHDYMEIARRGGGIHSSVRDLRARDEADLERLGERRLRRLASYGITTVEVKSGYGLTVADEIKMLRIIGRLAARMPMRVVPTFLGAHEIPLDHRDSAASRRAYVDLVINDMLPAVEREKLAEFADVFCETGVFTV